MEPAKIDSKALEAPNSLKTTVALPVIESAGGLICNKNNKYYRDQEIYYKTSYICNKI